MKRLPPLMWISLGLVSLMISFLLVGDLVVNLVPEEEVQDLKYRTSLSEALAVQYSELARQENLETISIAMRALVENNNDVLSAALRRTDGTILAQAGDHDRHWTQPPGDQSTYEDVQVPIFDGKAPWGTLQVAFSPSHAVGFSWMLSHPWVRFVAFVAPLGFLGYLLFMKRTLRELDPSAVIPQRVQTALDALAEGVVLLDNLEFIVLANATFARSVDRDPSALLGYDLAKFPWERPNLKSAREAYPWTTALRVGKPVMDVSLELPRPTGESTRFKVNSVPILDDSGSVRGVLTSFEDITELEIAIERVVASVQESETLQAELVRQNEELERLAIRDPLTGCFNRRNFLEKVDEEFRRAWKSRTALSCVVVDIDRCKSLNDRYGNEVGDQVIHVVARVIGRSVRPSDHICRYEREKFCVIFPALGKDETAQVAERIRRKTEAKAGSAIRTIPGLEITVSVGVSSTALGATEPFELIDHADKALSVAKEKGGNRVMSWGGDSTALETPSLKVAGNIATLLRLHQHQSASAQRKLPTLGKSPAARES